MSLSKTLYQQLGPLVSDRCFPDVAPLSTHRPYITWKRIGGTVINYDSGEPPDIRNPHVQVNVWADTREGADALAMQVEVTLRQTPSISARPLAESTATHDPDLKLFGTIQDFSIWSAA